MVISFHVCSRFECNCGFQPELVCQKCVRAIEDQVRPSSAQRRENCPTPPSQLLIISLRQSQTITAQKAAVSVAAGTAIGMQAFVCSFRLGATTTRQLSSDNRNRNCSDRCCRHFPCGVGVSRLHPERPHAIPCDFGGSNCVQRYRSTARVVAAESISCLFQVPSWY